MKALLFILIVSGCGGGESTDPTPLPVEPVLTDLTEVEEVIEPSEPTYTPGQQQARAEGRFAAQDDLARGIVQIVDLEVDLDQTSIDERTGLPLGTMEAVSTFDPTAWRDAYNDTVLDYVAATPPFPVDLGLRYTVSSHPDGVRHLNLEITSDSVVLQREGLDVPVEISVSERLQLGILARRSRVTVTGRTLGPGMRVEFVVDSETEAWSFVTEYPADRIGSSSTLGQLLETIAQR